MTSHGPAKSSEKSAPYHVDFVIHGEPVGVDVPDIKSVIELLEYKRLLKLHMPSTDEIQPSQEDIKEPIKDSEIQEALGARLFRKIRKLKASAEDIDWLIFVGRAGQAGATTTEMIDGFFDGDAEKAGDAFDRARRNFKSLGGNRDDLIKTVKIPGNKHKLVPGPAMADFLAAAESNQ